MAKKTKKTRVTELVKGDLIDIGGTMFEVVSNNQTTLSLSRRHLELVPLEDGDPLYDRVALFVPNHMKFHNWK